MRRSASECSRLRLPARRLVGGDREFAAQPGHVHVERLRRLGLEVVPHLGEDLVAADDLPGPAHQHAQQLELLVRQLYLVRVHSDQSRAEVHPDAARFEHLRHPAAQQRADPREQFGEPERLGHVIVRARVEADDEIDLVGARGEHQHRQFGAARAQSAAHFQPVHPGQPEIEHEQVDPVRGGRGEHRRAVGDDLDLVPLPVQRAGQRLGDGRIVFGK